MTTVIAEMIYTKTSQTEKHTATIIKTIKKIRKRKYVFVQRKIKGTEVVS